MDACSSGCDESRWDRVRRRIEDAPGIYVAYTILFALAASTVFASYWLHGRTFIWIKDGAMQHLPALIYFVDWLKSAVSSIAHGRAPAIWDLRVGLGSDIAGTLNFYGFCDPLCALAALVPESHTWVAYTCIAVLRLYLAGAAFCLYCRYFRFESWSILFSSLVYTFSCFSITVVTRHPFFILPMVFLPLICLGVEHILQKKSSYLYVFALSGMLWCNFYFAYMVCIFVFGYVVIRYSMVIASARPRVLLAWIAQFAIWSLVATLLAAPMLIPNIESVLDSMRSGAQYYTPLLYKVNYYGKLLLSLGYSSGAGKWCYIGCSALIVPSLMLLFSSRGRGFSILKIAALALMATVTLPMVGRVFNGMSYVANRHTFGIIFFSCVLIAWALPRLFALRRGQMQFVVGGTVCYALVLTLAGVSGQVKGLLSFGSVCFIIAVMLIAAMIALAIRGERTSAISTMLSVVVAFSVFVFGGFSVARSDESSRLTNEQAVTLATENVFAGYAPADENGIFRCDASSSDFKNQSGTASRLNQALLTEGVYYDSQYFSETNRNLSAFFQGEMEVASRMHGYFLRGANERATLLDLLSTRYWYGSDGSAPYGFEETGTKGVYENPSYLHFGYTYDSAIGRSVFDALNSVDKQEALLQSALVEDGASVDVRQGERPSSEVTCLKPGIVAGENVKVKADGVYKVGKRGGELDLSFEAPGRVELYVELRGIQMLDSSLSERTIAVESGKVKRKAMLWPSGGNKYVGFDNVLFHVGYLPEPRSTAKVHFESKGVYSISDVIVYALPMENHAEYVEKLNREHLDNVVLSENAVSGDISTNSTKLLCLPMTYSAGWRATVDGKECPTLRLNTWMLGVQLGEGSHHVEFSYEPPLGRMGLMLSLLGFIVLIIHFALIKQNADRRGYHRSRHEKKGD